MMFSGDVREFQFSFRRVMQRNQLKVQVSNKKHWFHLQKTSYYSLQPLILLAHWICSINLLESLQFLILAQQLVRKGENLVLLRRFPQKLPVPPTNRTFPNKIANKKRKNTAITFYPLLYHFVINFIIKYSLQCGNWLKN